MLDPRSLALCVYNMGLSHSGAVGLVCNVCGLGCSWRLFSNCLHMFGGERAGALSTVQGAKEVNYIQLTFLYIY